MNELNLTELVVYQELINLQEENQHLKDNWNELKNWLEENWKHSQDIWFVKIINKMQELERKKTK